MEQIKSLNTNECIIKRRKRWQKWADKNREYLNEWAGEYREKNREEIRKRHKAWRDKNKERLREYTRKHYLEHKEEEKERKRKQHARAREKLIQYYGGKCICCGEKTIEFLSVHHINNDGKKQRSSMTMGTSYYRWMLKNKPLDIAVLCHNCNLALGFYGYCPHKQGEKNASN